MVEIPSIKTYSLSMFCRPISFRGDKMIALFALRMLLCIRTDPTIMFLFRKNGCCSNGQIGPISLYDHMLFSCPIINRKGSVN